MYPLSILDVETLVNIDEITQFYTEIVSRNLVQLDASFFDFIRRQANEDGVTAFLSPIGYMERSIHGVKIIERGCLPYDDGVTSE